MSLQGQLQEVDRKVISPDFLFPVARDYQERLYSFQDEIDLAVGEAISAVSQVLEKSTGETLGQYESHVDRIELLYTPTLAVFEGLTPGLCKSGAERILNDTTSFTGFSASNCANQYNRRVVVEVDNANNALTGFDDIFSQVQSIVVKAFVGQNVYLTPENIRDRFENVYGLVRAKWEASSPGIAALRASLQAAIGNQNAELGNCHKSIETNAAVEFGRFADMVKTCKDFEDSRTSDGVFKSKSLKSFEEQLDEFLVEHAKLKLYEWTA